MATSLCPVCSAASPIRFLRREDVPVQQNLLVASEEAARSVQRGTLDLHVCGSCGFVFNAAFDPALLDYGEHYDNTQSFSAAFETHMDGLVQELVENKGVRNARIIEIGCGKGLFLRKLVEWPESGNTGIGFDTSYVGPTEDLDGRLRFERSFYDERAASVSADAVVCRHVIEHVPAPRALMTSVRGALVNSPDARLWFETPCVDWILRNEVLWDFFYEHCSLFTAHSLARLFRETGFEVQEVRHVFGGQYLWLEARPAQRLSPAVEAREPETSALAVAYGAQVEGMRAAWRARLSELGLRGRVAIWGAGAKGATFSNLVDPDARLIDCVVDLNPAKQGKFIPGTGHPIVAPEALGPRHVSAVLVMNPNYRAEIAALLQRLAPTTELLEWSSP
jgi:SAM-dependent methyltransferase